MSAVATTQPRRELPYPELLRCMFCTLVVLGHCDLDFIGLAIAGVAGFLAMSMQFACSDPDPARLHRRAKATLALWLMWSALYMLLLVARDAATHRPTGDFFEPWMLAMGPSMHLWFLPALCLSLLVLEAAVRLLPHATLRWAAPAIAAAAFIARVECGPSALSPPFGQALLSLFLASLAAACAWWMPTRITRSWTIPLWLALAAGIACTRFGWTEFAAYLIVVPATVGLCRVEQPGCGRSLLAASALTSGIYLVHPAVIATLKFVATPSLPWTPAVLLASAALVGVARQTRVKKWFG